MLQWQVSKTAYRLLKEKSGPLSIAFEIGIQNRRVDRSWSDLFFVQSFKSSCENYSVIDDAKTDQMMCGYYKGLLGQEINLLKRICVKMPVVNYRTSLLRVLTYSQSYLHLQKVNAWEEMETGLKRLLCETESVCSLESESVLCRYYIYIGRTRVLHHVMQNICGLKCVQW